MPNSSRLIEKVAEKIYEGQRDYGWNTMGWVRLAGHQQDRYRRIASDVVDDVLASDQCLSEIEGDRPLEFDSEGHKDPLA